MEDTTQEFSKKRIRFDGMYFFPEEDYKRVLRFYEDGTVLTVSTVASATVNDLIKWFSIENVKQPYSIGKYFINDNNIRFTSSSSEGNVDYYGEILPNNKLKMRWESFINGNRGEGTYYFNPIDAKGCFPFGM